MGGGKTMIFWSVGKCWLTFLSNVTIRMMGDRAQNIFPLPCLHQKGKDRTWKIERKNLNFRTYLKHLSRRTICFSKNEQMHDW
jgi:IS1 family transposase